jgi:hypothetical protein
MAPCAACPKLSPRTDNAVKRWTWVQISNELVAKAYYDFGGDNNRNPLESPEAESASSDIAFQSSFVFTQIQGYL